MLVEALDPELHWVGGRQDDDNKARWFARSGFSVCFEHQEEHWDTGLFEVATPECEGPEALVLRLRAIDEALQRAFPRAEEALAAAGSPGTLTLVKGSRDGHDEYFGRQDNIEAQVVRPLLLPLWWLAVLALSLGTTATASLAVFWLLLHTPRLLAAYDEDQGVFVGRLAADETLRRGFRPVYAFLGAWLRAASRFLYPDLAGPLEGFLLSRALLSGAGHLDADGRFWLSGKAEGITSWWRSSVDPSVQEHAVYATHSLLKPALVAPLRWRTLRTMLRRRHRLQIGLADSNRCETAEVLAETTLARVVALAERGELHDAPRFPAPLQALRTLTADATLEARVEDRTGRSWSIVELQAWYHRRVADAFPHDPVVALWGEALLDLPQDPSRWTGRLDWVTKRTLLEQCAGDADVHVRKRLDVGYGELGRGPWHRLVDALRPPPLLDPEDVRAALEEPPSGPATLRAGLIREHGDELVGIAWDHVRLPDRVIWLGSARS